MMRNGGLSELELLNIYYLTKNPKGALIYLQTEKQKKL